MNRKELIIANVGDAVVWEGGLGLSQSQLTTISLAESHWIVGCGCPSALQRT